MKVLLVEDSARLQRAISLALKRAGYVVDATADGEEGLWLASSNNYDAVILDLMLPGLPGEEILGQLRRQEVNTPILILSVRSTIEERIAGLRQGADDYLGKPFSMDELLARVESLVRRKYGHRSPVLKAGDLVLDPSARTAQCRGQTLELSPREYRLLEFLLRQPGKVVSRSEIEQHLYSDETELFSNVVESTISVLRKKLEQAGLPSVIQTRRGLGYVISNEDA